MAQGEKHGSGRIETVTKTHAVAEGTQARVKDPLWMLGRQWQMDEFTASNGGRLVRTEVDYQTLPVDGIRLREEPEGSLEELNLDLPLEARVEEEDSFKTSPAWDPRHLEYNFQLEKEGFQLSATEYDGHNLDWFSFDLQQSGNIGGEFTTINMRPHPVSYSGMPSARWWAFEDQKIDLGDVRRPHLNILTMLLMEFGLIFSEDWYLIPITHLVGNLRRMERIRSTDSFGVVVESLPVVDHTPNKQGFELFTLFSPNAPGEVSDGTLFYLPNNVWHALEGRPIEQVSLMRDELANLVWAVENRVEGEDGVSYNRYDTPRQKIENPGGPEPDQPAPHRPSHYFVNEDNPTMQRLIERPAQFEEGEPGKQILGPVTLYEESRIPPSHWVPYLQRLIDDQVVLRRARTQVAVVPPQFLGQFLEESQVIAEEEVPRTGVALSRLYQLARGCNEERVLWRGRKKRPDYPRNSSNLRFDSLIES